MTYLVIPVQGANLLVTSSGRIKLADFGASRKIEELASCGECSNLNFVLKSCALNASMFAAQQACGL